MKHLKKIAIYSGDIPSTTFIERLVQGISGTGNRVYLFGFSKSPIPQYNQNVSVFSYKNTKVSKGFHLLKYTLLLFLFRKSQKSKLDRILKAKSKFSARNRVKFYPVLWHKPDIFHIQWAKSLEDWVWVKDFGIKLVLSLRGAHINYSPIADKTLAETYSKLFPEVDAFHAVSKAIGIEAQKYGANSKQIRVVYSGLDLQNTSKVFNTSESRTFKILSIGRAHWIKGYNYALDACKILKAAQFDFNYTIIGGADNIELSYQLQDLDLNDNVTLTSQLPFEEVQTKIQQSDLLLLPSLKEGLANVVLEAMSLNTLVLSTDCGGMNEVITDGTNGFLTPIRDVRAMAEKIIEIAAIADKQKRIIIHKAKEHVSAHHSTQQMVRGMLELYESLE